MGLSHSSVYSSSLVPPIINVPFSIEIISIALFSGLIDDLLIVPGFEKVVDKTKVINNITSNCFAKFFFITTPFYCFSYYKIMQMFFLLSNRLQRDFLVQFSLKAFHRIRPTCQFLLWM